MMRQALFIFSFLVTFAVAGDAQAYNYNDRDKHDPFWPLVSADGNYVSYDGEVVVADIVLQGILLDSQGHNVALVNGKIVKPGDKVGDYVIEAVGNDHVNLLRDQERSSIKLQKGKI